MKSVIDLFSGVGGLGLGAVYAGLDLVGSVELDEITYNTHLINFPNSGHLRADVTQLHGRDLLINFKQSEIYGLIGGPPCQGFSTIGKRRVNDPRNRLFIHFFRLVSETQPVFFMAENVKGILQDKFSDILSTAFKYIENDYIMLPPLELNAKDFGVPTSRTRIIFIGVRKDINTSLSVSAFQSFSVSENVTVSEAFDGLDYDELSLVEPGNSEQTWIRLKDIKHQSYAHRLSQRLNLNVGNDESKDRYLLKKEVTGMVGTRHTVEVLNRFSKLKPGETDKISRSFKLDPLGLCPTLRAGTSSANGSFQAVRPIHPNYNRVITPREAARIQGFPDWFLFHPTKWHSFKQIGNSVSPLMGEGILRIIDKYLEV